ncbi:MAG: RDD family protein [Candidatus Limnocylindrales bacterium]
MTAEPTPRPTTAWRPPEEIEGPAPGVRYADHGARLLSYLLDLLIAGIGTVVIVIVFGLIAGAAAVTGQGLLAGLAFGLLFVALIGVSVAYFPYFWTHGGQTPGMRPFGLKVVMDRDGGPVTIGPAILRLIGFWIDGFVFYLGFVWVLIDKRRRGWHDLIAGTVVIQRR